jgi:ankyrin repeat protein
MKRQLLKLSIASAVLACSAFSVQEFETVPMDVSHDGSLTGVNNVHRSQRRLTLSQEESDGQTDLMIAIIAKNIKQVRDLLDSSSTEVHAQDNNGKTALMYAAESGNAEIVDAVAKQFSVYSYKDETEEGWYHYFVNYKDNEGKTALMHAVLSGSLESVKLVLRIAAISMNVQDNNGKTALMYAAESGNAEIVDAVAKQFSIFSGKYMYSDKYNTEKRRYVYFVNYQDNEGKTALMYAVLSGSLESVKLVLRIAAISMNIQDNNGKTALMYAAVSGNPDIVNAVAEKFSMYSDQYMYSDKYNTKERRYVYVVNYQDNEGKTALMHAVLSGNVASVKGLLNTYKIDVKVKNNNGQTAMNLAQNSSHENKQAIIDALNSIGGEY